MLRPLRARIPPTPGLKRQGEGVVTKLRENNWEEGLNSWVLQWRNAANLKPSRKGARGLNTPTLLFSLLYLLLLPPIFLTQLKDRAPGILVDTVYKGHPTEAQSGAESGPGGRGWKIPSTPPFYSSLHSWSSRAAVSAQGGDFLPTGQKETKKKVNISGTSSECHPRLPQIVKGDLTSYFLFCLCTPLGPCTAHHTVILPVVFTKQFCPISGGY